jgi:hypothetical protein
MSLEENQTEWKDVSEDVLSGMIEWPLQHPKATLREIEEAVDDRLGRLRKRMVEYAIQASSAADWGQQPEKDRPCCRQCGRMLVSRGSRSAA